MRRAKQATEQGRSTLAEGFRKLRSELDRRLPFSPAAGLSMQLLDPEPNSRLSGRQVLCSVQPGGDSFQLGMVAGALIVLAAEMDLACTVQDLDPAGGRMQLLLEDRFSLL